MKLKYAVIEWKDHFSYGTQEWRPLDASDRGSLYKCVTAGFILSESKELITLGLTLGGLNSNNLSFSGDITIAKKLITKKKVFNWKVKDV